MCNPPPPQIRRFTSVYYFSSNNSKNSNWRHISLTGSDHWNSKLSNNIQCKENNHSALLIFQKLCQNIKKENYISGIFWAFKSKLQIILAATLHCFFRALITIFYMYNTIYRDRCFSNHFEELQTVSIGVKLIIKNTPLTYVYANTIKTYLTPIICADKINRISNHFW